MSTFDEKPILQGVLWKRAQKSGSNWKRRYFKLFATRLTYSERANGKEKGKMEFNEEFFVQDYNRAPKGKFGFLVTDFQVSHYLAAESKDQKDFWCHAIATVIRRRLDQVRYFEDVRKSVKAKDEDMAEKQYQARLDNYYKTVGRPTAKQNRKSIVDFRAAQMMAEATEAAKLAEQAKEAEKDPLKREAERLAKEAAMLREQAEKEVQAELVIGPAAIPEDEADADDDDDDEAPEVPPMPDAHLEVHVAAPPSHAPIESSSSPTGLKQPPPLPPRKNTIQPTSAAAAAIETFAEGHQEVPPEPKSPKSPFQQSRSGSVLTSPSNIGNREPGAVTQPRPSVTTTQQYDKADAPLSPSQQTRRPTVTTTQQVTDASPASPTRRPTLQANGSSSILSPATESKPDTPLSPSRKQTTTQMPPPSAEPQRKPTVTSPPLPVVEAQRKPTVTSPPPAPVVATPPSAPSVTTSPPAPVLASPPPEPSAVASPTAAPPKVSGGLASKLGMWQNRVEQHQDKQANNIFSGSFQSKGKPEISKDQYGKAPEGSKTEERAKAAQEWVEQEIEKLIKVILEMGTYDPQEGGIKTVQFGPLFYKYADISDTLGKLFKGMCSSNSEKGTDAIWIVGILMRAKKRKRIMYQGDMLFQTMHDHVKITVLQA